MFFKWIADGEQGAFITLRAKGTWVEYSATFLRLRHGWRGSEERLGFMNGVGTEGTFSCVGL